MKFKTNTKALVDALDLVSSVPPKPTVPGGVAGFLFKVEGDECHIYSRDTQHVAKAKFSVEDAEDGAFVYPSSNVSALRYLGDQDIWFESKAEGESFSLSYRTEGGTTSDKVTVDPDLFLTCDDDLAAATDGPSFPAAALKQMLATVKPFLAPPQDTRADDHLKTVQVFDAKAKAEYKDGDGYMLGTNGVVACFVQSTFLEGKGLAVHGTHLTHLMDFLGQVEGEVKVKNGASMSFAVDDTGKVFGWAHHSKLHPVFRIYGLEQDGYVLRVPRKLFADALSYVRAEMDSKSNKIRLLYRRDSGNGKPDIRIKVEDEKSKVETFSIPVAPVEENGALKVGDKDWSLSMNIDHLQLLLSGINAHEAELRVSLVTKGPKTFGMFRTRDVFRVDDAGKVAVDGAHECTVIRWSPSKE